MAGLTANGSQYTKPRLQRCASGATVKATGFSPWKCHR
jgi:hypothetical protein